MECLVVVGAIRFSSIFIYLFSVRSESIVDSLADLNIPISPTVVPSAIYRFCSSSFVLNNFSSYLTFLLLIATRIRFFLMYFGRRSIACREPSDRRTDYFDVENEISCRFLYLFTVGFFFSVEINFHFH